MLRDLTPSQRSLAHFVSELSEESYCAGWMDGFEYEVWEALMGEREKCGWLVVTDEHRARLRQLSEDCGGWITFDDGTQETWLSLADWQMKFARRKGATAEGGG
jgi:hypothetical protein